MRDRMGIALRVMRVGKTQVGVVEQREDFFRGGCHLAGAGEDGFLGVGQDVLPHAEQLVERTAVELEARLVGVELLHLRVAQLQDPGREPCPGARELSVERHDLRGVRLVLGVARVLVALALRPVDELAHLEVDLRVELQKREQLRGGF